VAAAALLRLEQLSGKREFREIAESALGAFAGVVEHFGLYVGTYALAVERLLLEPIQIVVVGEGQEASRLEALATARYAPNKTVIRLKLRHLLPETLPPGLAETLTQLPMPKRKDAFAMVCLGTRCLPPVETTDELLAAMGLAG
jgi:hypothetical protein